MKFEWLYENILRFKVCLRKKKTWWLESERHILKPNTNIDQLAKQVIIHI
jgi:hypothetical protein